MALRMFGRWVLHSGFLCLYFVTASSAMASSEAYRSRPSDEEVLAATSSCTRTSAAILTDVIGISDPHVADPTVRSLTKELGVKWVRMDFHWGHIERGSGVYDWSAYDSAVADLRTAGINILGIINVVAGTPDSNWSDIDQRFQRFMAALVQRYSRLGLHYWEVFNEPNLPGFGWLDRGMKAEDFYGAYTLLLARANTAIRRHDPKGVIILGGMSPDGAAITDIWRLGGKNCFDVFAYHPYGASGKWSITVAEIRKFLKENGDDPNKPVWFNEFGTTDEATRVATLDQAFAERSAANALFWLAMKDWGFWGLREKFGLADSSERKRPAFSIFQQHLSRVPENGAGRYPSKAP